MSSLGSEPPVVGLVLSNDAFLKQGHRRDLTLTTTLLVSLRNPYQLFISKNLHTNPLSSAADRGKKEKTDLI